MADVEMKPLDDVEAKEHDEKPSPVAEIRSNVALIERAVSTLEPRFTHRVLRTLTALRKRLDDAVLRDAIGEIYTNDDSQAKKALLVWLPAAPPQDHTMDVDTTHVPSTHPKHAQPEPVPESEIYFRLLILHHLLMSPSNYEKAMILAHETVQRMQALNRRSMDPIAAKVWYAVERTYELLGELAGARPLFLAAQRTASLRHDAETQATLINCILRSYILYNLYDQADKFVTKTTFPASAANAQFSRYHYYLGRIHAVQLKYSAAHDDLEQAERRAPPQRTAPGFYQAVQKLSIAVKLLMGEIPERGLFRQPVLEKALIGYFEIVKAVRNGSLSQFQSTLSKYAADFEKDKTYTLIVRLRQNVIKTGIRRLSLSYSRISLRDICVKLHLDSEEDAEYIVGKAIRDGVIEGRIVHEKGWMECGGQKGGYGPEVSDVFTARIQYCTNLHNESVKAMRYPLNAHRKDLVAAENARERERELAKEIAEGGDLDDEGPDLGEGF
ncbi:hypothetical protein IEO21_08754 [Rhodonia placenta]|uniref:PCI domain-containing protein n=1 Tax=Rhodonia placenta TaxID=104341 RepID=A0A8H7NVL0_9APHY|nr:hypothetical protein IEO21_08754 [Postia placenta]